MTVEKDLRQHGKGSIGSVRSLGLVLVLFVTACGPTELLRLTFIEPVDTAVGLATFATVTGEGLEPEARAKLIDLFGSTFSMATEVDPSGTMASFMVPSGLASGVYDVQVVNLTGDVATLESAFTVYDGGLEITFLNVGQGDSTFIRSPRGDTLLKDAGTLERGRSSVIPFLSRLGALPPKHIIASHRHEDHLGGIVAILEGPDAMPGTEDDGIPRGHLLHNEPYQQCNSSICGRYDAASRGKARVAELGEVINLGAGVTASVVAVSGKLQGGVVVPPAEENSASVAVVVEFGDLRVFVGGDLTGGGLNTGDMETPLSATIAPIHVLRVNHHGSSSSTNVAFAQNLRPAAAVISAGQDNPYCHPHRSVMTRLEMVGAHVLLTTPGIVHPTVTCSEPTYLPEGAVVANGHIRLRSDDGRRFSIGPSGGTEREFLVR